MLELLLAIFLGFASPAQPTHNNNSVATTATTPGPGDAVGGDGGLIPPRKP